jgi:hypothetical protein
MRDISKIDDLRENVRIAEYLLGESKAHGDPVVVARLVEVERNKISLAETRIAVINAKFSSAAQLVTERQASLDRALKELSDWKQRGLDSSPKSIEKMKLKLQEQILELIAKGVDVDALVRRLP